MWRMLLAFCLIVTPCFGDHFNGPVELSLKLFDELSIDGSAKLKMVRAKSLVVKGSLEYSRLSVSGKATVDGQLTGDRGKFGQLTVTGPVHAEYLACDDLSTKGDVTISYLDVKNRADIDGIVSGQNWRVKDLQVRADKIVLKDVDIGTIVVKKSGTGPEELTLQGTSVIHGMIVFESGQGKVRIEGDKVKIEGEIKGGSRYTENH